MLPEFQNNVPPVNNPIQNNPVPPAENPLQLEPPRKHIRLILLTVIMILIGILAVGYFLYYKNSGICPAIAGITNKNGKCVFENQNLTIATSTDSTSSLQADQFADWKTYTNSQYGFVFKYPNDWTINTSEKSVSLNSPERIKLMDVEVPDNFDFSVIEKSSSQDVVSFSNSIDNGWFTHYKSQISLKVDDRSAIKFDDISDSVPSQPPIAVLYHPQLTLKQRTGLCYTLVWSKLI